MDKKTLTLAVKEIEGEHGTSSFLMETIVTRFCCLAANLSAIAAGQKSTARQVSVGVILANTMVIFERAEGSTINLAGKSKG
jgi:hypothetical protein